MPANESRRPSRFLIGGLGLAVVVAVLLAEFCGIGRDRSGSLMTIRPSGIPAGISTSIAGLMALSPVPNRLAPKFTLVDQDGRTRALADFRGHAVVLGFSDPHCTDVCPIVSQELIDAYRDLGMDGAGVDFGSVNVNPYVTRVTDLVSYSKEHGLISIPSWHFLTGSVSDLEGVWRAYGVEVDASSPNADVIHTDAIYFIDSRGHERYVASPMVDHTAAGTSYLPAGPLASWGSGIALLARSLSGRGHGSR